jgi:hypothetical protein
MGQDLSCLYTANLKIYCNLINVNIGQNFCKTHEHEDSKNKLNYISTKIKNKKNNAISAKPRYPHSYANAVIMS